ncbi:uncharacterized protein [Nothobranchius furzeri]|uniref:uncharacterized protein n=1 Tax=Nothobranchius furzeri TaxID=105023 RepID=UPI003904E13D
MLTAGRKRREDVWSHFSYDNIATKTTCRECGLSFRGKNTTNLKRHLQNGHFAIFSELQKTIADGGQPATKKAKMSNQNIEDAFTSTTKYKSDAKDQQIKEEAIATWIGCTGLPVTTVEDEDFILMMESLDKKFTVPKKTKISNLIEKHYENKKATFKKRLSSARKVCIGTDLWTKKGLTASFLGISCCFFCVEQQKPEHLLLALEQLDHPHTAQSIKACVEKCMQEWGIPNEKVLSVITDNGSNMVAAFKHSAPEDEDSSSDDPDASILSESDSKETENLQCQDMGMDRMPCVVHTLQLVVHMINKEESINRVLNKVRSIVKLFRKSSVATQKILDECSLTVVNDCPTRCHLADVEQNTSRDVAALARKMEDDKFSPLVAAACFLNPTVCQTLLNVADDNIQELLKQAEGYVVRCSQTQENHSDLEELNGPEPAPPAAASSSSSASSSSRQPVFRPESWLGRGKLSQGYQQAAVAVLNRRLRMLPREHITSAHQQKGPLRHASKTSVSSSQYHTTPLTVGYNRFPLQLTSVNPKILLSPFYELCVHSTLFSSRLSLTSCRVHTAPPYSHPSI